ncbi:uncharacterized protein LOC116001361 [Ipomoea triloba]|uniref:uncharacterized protein LOC116001361 n=1 Tax=Ipomoea triloba TaxID=35885 RepID=UPI00125D0DF0|nr:uncharacterized protein LOC116001361 [Ipomoea triloba]
MFSVYGVEMNKNIYVIVTVLWDSFCDLPSIQSNDDFAAWLSKVIEGRNDEAIRACMALCWSIWKSRNDLLWNTKPWTPSEVVRRAVLLAEEWNTLFAAPGNLLINGSEHAIDPGINDGVIIHVDAAVFSDREEGYVSAVVHGSDGGYLAARNCSVRSLRNPILAEAMAVKEALSWAKDRGWHKVVLYSDCQLVCNLLKSSLPNNSYVGCIVRDCVSLKRYFVDVSFHYIARSANTLAHVLARATASQSGPGVWFSSFPNCIQHLLLVN